LNLSFNTKWKIHKKFKIILTKKKRKIKKVINKKNRKKRNHMTRIPRTLRHLASRNNRIR